MQGLAANTDLSAMLGVRVVQVGISTHQCILWFDSGDRISIESTCVLNGMEVEPLVIESYPTAASHLATLLEQSVVAARPTESGGVLLQFGDRRSLEIRNDVREYESFQIQLRGVVLVA